MAEHRQQTSLATVLTADQTVAGAASVGDYIALLKPRVMSLAVFTAGVGLAIAPKPLHPVLAVTALILIAMGAGASGALNMYYDADIDAKMARTRSRPIPRGVIAREEAAAFGLFLAVFSVLSLGLLVNWVAASLLAASIGIYLAVYTAWLKRRTPQNIVIGGAAGALPPMIGWAATSGDVSWASFSLFLIIFLWTPAHFWALALYRSGDYERAGVPMLPVVKGARHTRIQIFLYALATVLASGLPLYFGPGRAAYAAAAALGGVGLVWLAARLLLPEERHAADKASRRLFGFSILYLFAIFAALLVDHGLTRVG